MNKREEALEKLAKEYFVDELDYPSIDKKDLYGSANRGRALEYFKVREKKYPKKAKAYENAIHNRATILLKEEGLIEEYLKVSQAVSDLESRKNEFEAEIKKFGFGKNLSKRYKVLKRNVERLNIPLSSLNVKYKALEKRIKEKDLSDKVNQKDILEIDKLKNIYEMLAFKNKELWKIDNRIPKRESDAGILRSQNISEMKKIEAQFKEKNLANLIYSNFGKRK